MAKCLRCGKNTIIRGHVALSDGAVCTPCFKKLGFKLTETAGASSYYYDDIKEGKDMLQANLEKRRYRHQKWLEDHSDVVDFMDALDEDPEETEENEEIEENNDF